MQTSFSLAQLADPDIKEADAILRRCVHCGFCTATCPTYLELGNELDSPRGRIYLIKDMLEGDKPASATVATHIDRCLSCLSCMTTCPSGVDYMHLVDQARIRIEETFRRPWADRVVREVLARTLPYPGRFRAALALAHIARPFASLLERFGPAGRRMAAMLALSAEASSGKTLARRRTDRGTNLSLAGRSSAAERGDREGVERGVSPDRAVVRPRAEEAAAPLAVPHPERLRRSRPPRKGEVELIPSVSPRVRVALLKGCAQSVLDPGINAAATRLLARFGVEAIAAPGEGCCGAIVHHMGRDGQAHALARAAIDAWTREIEARGLDAIVITTSGCGSVIKDYGHMFRLDPAYAEKAARVSALALDISEYLAKLDLPPAERPMETVVAYHSACSLQHGQRITTLPKTLLERAGFAVRDVPEAHICCGSAGTYNILQPEIAARLRERKVRNIESIAPDIIAAGNIGCMTQIGAGTATPVVHTVELLDWAYGGERPAALGA